MKYVTELILNLLKIKKVSLKRPMHLETINTHLIGQLSKNYTNER